MRYFVLGVVVVLSQLLLSGTAIAQQSAIDLCNRPCGSDVCPIQGPNCPPPPAGSLPYCARLNPTIPIGVVTGWPSQTIVTSLKAANMTWARTGVGWDTVEATPGIYNWTISDSVHSVQRGVNMLWGVSYSPGWIAGGKYMPPRRPDELARFQEYVETAALRYPDVLYWEPWNEPNSSKFFLGTVADYVNLLRTMKQALTAAQTVDGVRRYIVGPGLQNQHSPSTDPVSFYNQLSSNGGSQYIDIVSDHYYGDVGHTTLDSFWTTRFALYDSRGLAGKDVWITETGYVGYGYNEATQDAYDIIMATYPAYNSRIKRVFLFTAQDHDYGIFDNYGRAREIYYDLSEIYLLQCRCNMWPWCQ